MPIKREHCFYKEVEIRFFDCDREEKARLATLMRYVADVAGLDYAARGYTHDWLWEHRQAFLLSRMSLKINRMPFCDEKMVVETWENGTIGATAQRNFNFYDEKDNIIATCVSCWILADPISRRILRPASFSGTIEKVNDPVSQAKIPTKIKYALPLVPLGTREVRYTDIDSNQHLYSGIYGNIIYDALPQELIKKEAVAFQIHFKQEAVLGDQICLSMQEETTRVVLVGKVKETVCFEAELFLK